MYQKAFPLAITFPYFLQNMTTVFINLLQNTYPSYHQQKVNNFYPAIPPQKISTATTHGVQFHVILQYALPPGDA